MTLGDSCFGVDVKPFGGLRIVDIERRAAGPIEASGGEGPPVEIARREAQAMTDIEAGAEGTAKAAALSGRRVTQPVTCCLLAAAPRLEATYATPAARLDRCRPSDPNATRVCAAPRSRAASRYTLSTSSLLLTGRARAPGAAARWRHAPSPKAAWLRPHPRRPRRPDASPLRAHISASSHPVLTLLRHAALSHQTRLHPSTPAFARSDPRITPCIERQDGSPRARNRLRSGRKCVSQAPRRIHRHDSALRARHAPGAQRALQHRRFNYNILCLGSSMIAKTV